MTAAARFILSIQEDLGQAITPKALASFLAIDSRTVVKYAHRWGGVEVAPGVWRFFAKRVAEVLDNGKFANEAGEVTMAGTGNGERATEREMVPGQFKEVRTKRSSMGKRNAVQSGKGKAEAPDHHGVFSE